ncbi:CDP-alcohol phosphatidyltransferase family protein [bacterium]|nr:CDP-alcohol phosphatidyltransferase family protein [bacterium]
MNSVKRIWTIPNLLSLLRLLLLVPMLVLLGRGQRWAVFGLALLGIAFDLSDGFLARRLNQCSDLGRIMDPVIDKTVTLSVCLFLVLSPLYAFPVWFFLFLLFREAAVLVGGWTVMKGRKMILESNRAGKWSAFTTGVAVLFYIMDWQPFAFWLVCISFVLTLYSSFTYIKTFLSKIRES